MGFWNWLKKDVGYFKTVARTEKRFHKTFWRIIAPNGLASGSLAPEQNVERQPWDAMGKALRETRMKQEWRVLIVMIVLWALLTAYLILSRNWEGFAIWLFFAALVIRSMVIIRKLKGRK